jgi:hypothetical protein
MPWVRLSKWRDVCAREERGEALLEQWDSDVSAARSDPGKFSSAFEVLGTCADELHEALDGVCDDDYCWGLSRTHTCNWRSSRGRSVEYLDKPSGKPPGRSGGAASDGAQSWRWRRVSPSTTSSDTDEEREEPNVT